MSLGEQLRKAREARKETASQVAAATRLKIQMIEAIEREDFSKIPAAIYGKGFIRLYAEHVGMDPMPLIQEYSARFSHPGRSSTDSPVDDTHRAVPEAAPAAEPAPAPEPGKEKKTRPRRASKDFFEPDLFSRAGISDAGSTPAVTPSPAEDEVTEKMPPLDREPVAEDPPAALPPVEVPEEKPEEPPAMEPAPVEAAPVPEPEPEPVVEDTAAVVLPAPEPVRKPELEKPATGEPEDIDSETNVLPPRPWAPRHVPAPPRPAVEKEPAHFRKRTEGPELPPKPAEGPAAVEEAKPADEEATLKIDFSGLSLSKSPARTAFLLLGVLIILVFVISGLSRCNHRKEESVPVITEPDKELRTAVDPPAPYFN